MGRAYTESLGVGKKFILKVHSRGLEYSSGVNRLGESKESKPCHGRKAQEHLGFRYLSSRALSELKIYVLEFWRWYVSS